MLSDAAAESSELSVSEAACDLLCGVFLEVVDAAGNAASCMSEVRVEDTTPPEFPSPGDQFEVSIWPHDHRYIVFDVADLGVTAPDNCADLTVHQTISGDGRPKPAHPPRRSRLVR